MRTDINDFSIKRGKSEFLIQIQLDITASTIDSIEDSFRQAAGDEGDCAIVLDLAKVEVIDSIGIGSLIKFHRILTTQDRELKVRGLSRDLFELFQWMRLDKHFIIEEHGEASK